ncbi:MAG: GNAT family N-acetyltransferase [Anaerolineaceae bacterium]|nr:GNAT family N-acetyltransferase [Anaerolineaceae bacterium]
MLKGSTITLRPVRDTDLDQLYAFHLDIDNRGDFFPRGVMSQPLFRQRFQESGFWNKEDGMLVIVSAQEQIVGHIEFFKTVNYLDEYELSYQVYAADRRGQGVATEAVGLLVCYLFENKRVNRIRLVIHPHNLASRRLAEKCGFRHEGTARGAWYHKGFHQDVEIYALLHADMMGVNGRNRHS